MGLRDKMEANAAARAASGAITYLPGTSLASSSEENVVQLPIGRLHSFQGHTFRINESAPDFLSLKEGIRANGILQPLLVRPHPAIPGDYEIVAGHRRRCIAQQCGLSEVPAIVRPMDNDTAIQRMAETNIQRPGWLPSEKAKTYLAHLEATQRKTGIAQGQRNDLTSGTRFPQFRNRDEAAKIWGISGKAFDLYIKLNDLFPPLLELADEGQIAVKAAYQLSFLTPEQQRCVYDVLATYPKKKLPDSKAKELRQAGEAGELDEAFVLRLLGLQRGPASQEKQVNIRFSSSTLLRPSTLRRVLDDPQVLEEIEQLLIRHAKKHDLPLR